MTESFETFMARALYDPERGYYSRHIQTVGAEGDFSTAATLSPLLGRAVAGWIQEESRQQGGLRNIIELGPGNGMLSRGIRRELGWWHRRRFAWHYVETSPVLCAQQQALLGAGGRWHTSVEEALRYCEGQALIFHNELLDAFPVIQVEFRAGQWQEVWIDWEDPWGEQATCAPRERLQPLQWTEKQRQPFGVLRCQAADGQRCELHRAVYEWLWNWAPSWRMGAMLSIDYGDTFPELYRRRPRGNVRAYRLQQRITGVGVYANPGRQDLTADVNFTDYRAWAQDLGWVEEAWQTQGEFIRSRISVDPGDPMVCGEGAGGAFKCVVHRKR
jgi:SAM-dependent MidA family methyltransferase